MSDDENRDKKKWYILEGHFISLLVVLLIAILFYVGLTHFNVITVRIKMFMKVLSPFIAGFAIAYLLNTPMCFFEQKLYAKRKGKRVLAITTVYLLALAVLVILLNLIIPQVVQSITDLAANMQTYLAGLDTLVKNLTDQFQLEGDGISEILGSYQDMMSNISETVSKALPQLLFALLFRAFLQLFHECLHALFKLPAVLCPGHDGGHVQHDNAFVEKDTRDVALANANGQTFYNGCLADAGFSDEDGVVFLAAAEDLRYALDLFFPTDDGVDPPLFRKDGKVPCVLVQVPCYGFAPVDVLLPADVPVPER